MITILPTVTSDVYLRPNHYLRLMTLRQIIMQSTVYLVECYLLVTLSQIIA
jgi:hypothetical protein